jgi:hypothetical protein
MNTDTPTPTGPLTDNATADQTTGPTGRGPADRRLPTVVALAMLTGLVTTSVLVLVVFAGATEAVITGSALLGLASGWALLTVLTTRLTSQPQRWAAVPAVVMATTGATLLAATPGDGALTTAGWVWPPAAFALAAWMVRAARRAMTGRARWLLYPVIGALAVAAVGGVSESIALTRDTARYRCRAPPTTWAATGCT